MLDLGSAVSVVVHNGATSEHALRPIRYSNHTDQHVVLIYEISNGDYVQLWGNLTSYARVTMAVAYDSLQAQSMCEIATQVIKSSSL